MARTNSGRVQIETRGLLSAVVFIIAACSAARIHSSLECLPYQSIVLIGGIDAFVAPVRAGLVKTRWIANKPCVGFLFEVPIQPRNRERTLYDCLRDDPVPVRDVGSDNVTNVNEAKHGHKSQFNFNMPCRVPCQKLIGFLGTF